MTDLPRPEEIAALLAAIARRPRNEDAAGLLPAMMRTLGLNPSAVQKLCTDLYATMELSCAGCENAAACRLWLEPANCGDPAYRHFCPNAEQMGKLRELL